MDYSIQNHPRTDKAGACISEKHRNFRSALKNLCRFLDWFTPCYKKNAYFEKKPRKDERKCVFISYIDIEGVLRLRWLLNDDIKMMTLN
jgi:hypothetical protein